jgi:alpha-glucosidase
MKIAFLLLACICAISAQHVHEDKDWWENAVFYQIYPRSFKDSYRNDGIGDIRGIIEKLDYLKELGVDGFWMNPVFLSPMKDFGYDIQSFYDIQEEYGTEADLEELFTKAKALGIKVIMDFVPNHTSDQHDWFIKSENNTEGFEDFYVWHEGKDAGIGVQPDLPNNWVRLC